MGEDGRRWRRNARDESYVRSYLLRIRKGIDTRILSAESYFYDIRRREDMDSSDILAHLHILFTNQTSSVRFRSIDLI